MWNHKGPKLINLLMSSWSIIHHPLGWIWKGGWQWVSYLTSSPLEPKCCCAHGFWHKTSLNLCKSTHVRHELLTQEIWSTFFHCCIALKATLLQLSLAKNISYIFFPSCGHCIPNLWAPFRLITCKSLL